MESSPLLVYLLVCMLPLLWGAITLALILLAIWQDLRS